MSSTGGTQKTVDIEMVLPSTGDTAFVQAKSSTTVAQFNKYMDLFFERSEKYMFYVYHSGASHLVSDDENIKILGPEKISKMILDARLFDWLESKVA